MFLNSVAGMSASCRLNTDVSLLQLPVFSDNFENEDKRQVWTQSPYMFPEATTHFSVFHAEVPD